MIEDVDDHHETHHSHEAPKCKVSVVLEWLDSILVLHDLIESLELFLCKDTIRIE